MKTLAMAAVAALLAATAATPASAAILYYTLTGTDTDGTIEFASFDLDDTPVILPNNASLGEGFRIKFVQGVFQYGDTVAYLQDLQFGNDSMGGGFFNLDPADRVGDTAFLITYGPQLYTGPETSPTLLTGRFTVYDAFSDAELSLEVTAVPEPATWGTMIAGFGLIGGAMRRRHRVRTAFSFA